MTESKLWIFQNRQLKELKKMEDKSQWLKIKERLKSQFSFIKHKKIHINIICIIKIGVTLFFLCIIFTYTLITLIYNVIF